MNRAVYPIWLLVCCALVGVLFERSSAQSLIINEFMASNETTLSDEDGDETDWIEIRNTGTQFMQIGGYHLTDDAGDLMKWVLPSPTYILGSSTIVIFASGKDRANPGQELHTNFKLTASGEYLALVAPDGLTILTEFSPEYPDQVEDVSYGFSANPSPTNNLSYFNLPTPDASNGIGGMAFGEVESFPSFPNDTDDIIVEAEVIGAPGVSIGTIALLYRVGFGGEVSTSLLDDGVLPDVIAGDGTYTGVVPHAISGPGDMLRWRVWMTDTGAGPTVQLPRFVHPYETPQYQGTMVNDPSTLSALPALHWFVPNPWQASTSNGTRCSVFYGGEFYDNILCRLRGGSSTSWSKPSYKLDFNKYYHFRFDPGEGRVEEINLNSTWGDKAYLRQILCMEIYRDSKAFGSMALPVRVEQNGAFHSLAVFVEQPDEEYLDRQGLDPNGALYKMFNQATSATSGVEKKTRLFENHNDLAALVSGVQQSGASLETYLFDNLDIPSVLNYLAATVLIGDNDHVHKNYYLYRDSLGDGEWIFLPWDKDLTLGRNYTLSGGVLNDSMWANIDPQCHPLFGDAGHPKVDGFWNRIIDACYRTPRLRAMFLRRLRSVMDELLQIPGTPVGQRFLENRMTQLQSIMSQDALLDRQKWGIPSWGNLSLNFPAGLTQMRNDYLTPRRVHLYQTHGGPGGLIPGPQGNVMVHLGVIEASSSSINPSEDYIEVVNCFWEAVDLTGFSITGSLSYQFPAGTVVGPGEALYIARDVVAFRARTSGPSGGQGLLVVGPFNGTVGAGPPLQIRDASGQVVGAVNGLNLSVTTTGVGDCQLSVGGAPSFAQLYIPMSTNTAGLVGCGPLVGIGVDALPLLLVPLGTVPFHVLADNTGQYFFSVPPNSVPAGFGVDVCAISVTSLGQVEKSAVSRVIF